MRLAARSRACGPARSSRGRAVSDVLQDVGGDRFAFFGIHVLDPLPLHVHRRGGHHFDLHPLLDRQLVERGLYVRIASAAGRLTDLVTSYEQPADRADTQNLS